MPLPVQCASTTCGTVNGTVTASESNQPLKGARVEWAGLAEVWGDRGDGVLTDAQGTYSIRIGPLGGPGSDQGQLMMRASKDGYVFRIIQVTLPAAQPINFSLPAAPTANGTVTWSSIDTTRALCAELRGQVGSTYPLWLIVHAQGASVTLKMSHDGPVTDDPTVGDSGYTFAGTRNGDLIAATLTNPQNQLGCPADTSLTPEVGGSLNARVSSNDITGQYTEVYGTGASQVVFQFQFRAAF